MAAAHACLACGYRLREVAGSCCPECGRAFDRDDSQTFTVTMARPAVLVRVEVEWLGEALRAELLASGVLSSIEVSLNGIAGFSTRRRVTLYVDEEDLERARAVLAESERRGESTWRCARCGEEVPGSFAGCWSCQAQREDGAERAG